MTVDVAPAVDSYEFFKPCERAWCRLDGNDSTAWPDHRGQG